MLFYTSSTVLTFPQLYFITNACGLCNIKCLKLLSSFIAVFILYYVLHGVLMERPFEILVSMVTVLIVLGYCIVDYVTNVNRRTSLKLVCVSIRSNIY